MKFAMITFAAAVSTTAAGTCPLHDESLSGNGLFLTIGDPRVPQCCPCDSYQYHQGPGQGHYCQDGDGKCWSSSDCTGSSTHLCKEPEATQDSFDVSQTATAGGECKDLYTGNGFRFSYTCERMVERPAKCTGYDKGDLVAADLCCACGGGVHEMLAPARGTISASINVASLPDLSGMSSVSGALARMSGVREDELEMLSENEREDSTEELLKAKARAAAAEELLSEGLMAETTETPAAPVGDSVDRSELAYDAGLGSDSDSGDGGDSDGGDGDSDGGLGTFESGLGTFHIGLFPDGCSPKKCPEWDCAKWCHCFETNPNVEAMFESVQYSADLAKLCPEDDTTCQC